MADRGAGHPELVGPRSAVAVMRFQHWLDVHHRQIIAAILLGVGAFMVTSGVARLV